MGFSRSIRRRCAVLLAAVSSAIACANAPAQDSSGRAALFQPAPARGQSEGLGLFTNDSEVGAGREIWAFDDNSPWVQRFGVAGRIGDGLGYRESYTSFEFFTPLTGDQQWENMFGDVRVNAQNDGSISANIGLGYRRLGETWNRILGLNGFYDHQVNEQNHRFQQLGLGIESLGPLIDVRANAYIPDIGAKSGAVDNAFVGNILIINRDVVTMPGADVEVGGRLPVLFGVQGSAYVGAYHFDGRQNPSATGWKARAQVQFNDWAFGDVQIQEDDTFGQTASVGVAIRYRHRWGRSVPPAERSMDHLFFRRPESDWRDIGHRLSEPVERLNYIVTNSRPRIARDLVGVPLNFLHVVPGAAGTGTFADPYGTLTTALADGDAGNSIIYTPEGGDFNENVTLVDGTSVLSNGPVQFVLTNDGFQQLPFSGTSPDLSNLPTIDGNVTMANASRFSGFEVTGQLTATNVTGFVVDNAVIENPAADAVVFNGVNAALLFNLQVESSGGNGLVFADSNVVASTITVRDAAADAIDISTTATDRVVALSNITISAATANGIDANVTGAGDLTLNLTGANTLTTAGNTINAATAGGSTGDLQLDIQNTIFSSSAGAGLNVDGTAGAGTIFVTALANNAVVRAATGGMLFNTVTFDADPTTGAIDQVDGQLLNVGVSTSTNLVGDGLRLIDPTGNLRFSTLNIFNRNGTGLLVDTKGGGTTFNLETAGGIITTTNGAALNLDPLTVDLVFTSVSSTNSPTSGILIDTTSGDIAIGTTILEEAANEAIIISNTPSPLVVNFGDLGIISTFSDEFDDNVDTSIGNAGNLTVIFDSVQVTGP
jgi:hypothetical protein